jgi:putative oxidoreductase
MKILNEIQSVANAIPLVDYQIAGRSLLAWLFVLAGLTKIIGPKPVLEHMRERHVPTALLPLVIAFELVAGSSLLSGWQPSMAAAALSGFCVATAIVFHSQFAIRAERTAFVKDLALAGALLFVAAAS